MTIGAVESAAAIVVTGTGAAQVVQARDGLLMGWLICSGTTPNITIYDAATTAQAVVGNLIVPTVTPVVGNAYSFRVAVVRGITIILTSGALATILVI